MTNETETLAVMAIWPAANSPPAAPPEKLWMEFWVMSDDRE